MEAALLPTHSMSLHRQPKQKSPLPVSPRDAALALILLGAAGAVFGNTLVLVLVTMFAGVLGGLCLLHWLLAEHPLDRT
jgi:hypothetical protein